MDGDNKVNEEKTTTAYEIVPNLKSEEMLKSTVDMLVTLENIYQQLNGVKISLQATSNSS